MKSGGRGASSGDPSEAGIYRGCRGAARGDASGFEHEPFAGVQEWRGDLKFVF